MQFICSAVNSWHTFYDILPHFTQKVKSCPFRTAVVKNRYGGDCMSIDLTPVVCAAHRLPALTTLCRDLDLPLTQGQLAMLAESHDRALQSAGRACAYCSSKRDIQRHHQAEAHGKKHSSDIGVAPRGHLRNQLFDNNIEHGSRGKAEQIRQRRQHKS